MKGLLGSHCAILVYWYERTGCCERDMDQLPVRVQRFCGRTGCSGIASDIMPTNLGTSDGFLLLDRFSRVLHLVEKVRYTESSRKRLDWMVHGLHGGQKVDQLVPQTYSRWCTDMDTLYLAKIYDHDSRNSEKISLNSSLLRNFSGTRPLQNVRRTHLPM
jgi:hypothetical protein